MESRDRRPIATDLETALILAKHINEPCSDEQGNNIRQFYINLAREELKKMKDPAAIQILEDTITLYNS